MAPLNGWLWYIVENYVYSIEEPPPRSRSVPLEVIAVGLPRSATKTLKEALMILGHENVHHAFDILFEQPRHRIPAWVRLIRLRHFPNMSSTAPFPGSPTTPTGLLDASHFDPLIGHCTALVDTPASLFAADLIHAYPNAKIILNTRKDADAWQRSVTETILRPLTTWLSWTMSWLDPQWFWMYHMYCRFADPIKFRGQAGVAGIQDAMEGKGRATKIEHEAMVRGLMIGQEHRFLEWSAEDGWGPLCEFLGKDVPSVKFPRVNSAGEMGETEKAVLSAAAMRIVKRLLMGVAVGVGVGAVAWRAQWLPCGFASQLSRARSA